MHWATILGGGLMFATVAGFPWFMIRVAFQFGDRITEQTGDMDAGALAAVCLTIAPTAALIALSISLLMRGMVEKI